MNMCPILNGYRNSGLFEMYLDLEIIYLLKKCTVWGKDYTFQFNNVQNGYR